MYRKLLTYFLLLLLPVNLLPVIRIVCTAALTDAFFEFRKQQYIEACFMLTKLGYKDFYIIEALKKQGPTFLDYCCPHVFYASANNPFLKNNGINDI